MHQRPSLPTRLLGTLAAASLVLAAAACSGRDDDSPTSDAAVVEGGPETAPGATDVDEPSDAEAADESGDAGDARDSGVVEEDEPTETALEEDPPEPLPEIYADADIRGGVEQLTLLGADPGTELVLAQVNDAGTDSTPVATLTVDEYGSLLARDLDSDVDYRLEGEGGATRVIDVLARDENPDPSFYAEQRLPSPGFGYVETRDGTLLSANVRLPGPVEDGPYPTVVEYSGYALSDPGASGFGDIFPALGYAYVAVNMRGSGCSGGSFRFFEYTQSTDGYDVIEAVAAQPWVKSHTVGMVGISYPGISQLFVAQTQPPSLSAITPLSVLDDSYQANVYPGGILNTGFAVEWTQDRLDDGRPAVAPDGSLTGDGQSWVGDQIQSGDETCASNQAVRMQNPDLVEEIRSTPFFTTELGDEIAPRTFVDRIEVPTFLAGAWQDEQTGGRFPTMIPNFTGTDHLYVTLLNGLHTESISPTVLPRMLEFLDLYVAERTPSLDGLRAVAPVLAESLYGASDITLPDDRFSGMSYEEALAEFESEPPVRIAFEQGAADGEPPLTPLARFEAEFDAWPIPSVDPTTFPLGSDATLRTDPEPTDAVVDYLALPDGVPATFWSGNSSDLWRTDVVWDWQEPAPGTFADFVSAPLDETLVMIGSASADLWVDSNLGDTDLEVTLTELRPDGREVMVQSGWLRASHRTLDDAESTELRPVHDHLESDASPLPASDTIDQPGDFELVRVEILPFAHAFREGSRIRMMVDAPGGNRATWVFETIADGEQVEIAVGPSFPSALVLPVVPDVDVPPDFPACDSLKGQPCR